MSDLRITEVRFVQARPEQVADGLIGFVAFVLDDALKFDSVALRRTRRGHPALSFPSRRDRQGRDHALIAPLSDGVRKRIESQVFDALGLAKEAR